MKLDVISEETLVQALTVCLYLCVQCPDHEKRLRFVERDIEEALDEERQGVVRGILLGMGVSFDSPDQFSDSSPYEDY